LPIRLDEPVVDELFARAASRKHRLTVCLETCRISDETGLSIPFEVEPFRRHSLLDGLDDIGLTMEHEHRIAAHEEARGIV